MLELVPFRCVPEFPPFALPPLLCIPQTLPTPANDLLTKQPTNKMSSFGDFAPLCTHTPSYPWCNLFYTQISRHNASVFSGSSASASSAPVGINPVCGILRVGASRDGSGGDGISGETGTGQSLGNVAQVVACALSLVFMIWLIWATGRRKAAVGVYSPFSSLFLHVLKETNRPNRTPNVLHPLLPHPPLQPPHNLLPPRTGLVRTHGTYGYTCWSGGCVVLDVVG